MKRVSRREILLAASAALIHRPGRLSAMTQEWSRVSPSEAGFTPDLEARLDKAVAEGRIWNLHGLVVLRDERLVLEHYFEGEDRTRGVGEIGHIAFKPATIHDLRSCSKSIVALLYGIALRQQKVLPPEASLFSAFPEYSDLAKKDGRDKLTIQHVLTMSLGTDWDESSLPYSDPRNSEIAMDNAEDRYRYILARPVIDTPGAHWTYCGGATALLARMITKGTGKSLHGFARENLFDPLGMGPTEWAVGRDGEPFAASGARMPVKSADKPLFLRIGLRAASHPR
jgi:CubicO group peptidase (beta-lactamase class C family)